MEYKKFKTIFIEHDLYVGIFKDGCIVSENKNKNNQNLFIIGIDISYDTIDYQNFNKFTLLLLTEFQIITIYRNVFGQNLLNKRLNIEKCSTPKLLFEIINQNKNTDINYRYNNIVRYFKPNKLPILEFDKIKDIIYIPKIKSKYIHIDINLGKNFN